MDLDVLVLLEYEALIIPGYFLRCFFTYTFVCVSNILFDAAHWKQCRCSNSGYFHEVLVGEGTIHGLIR